MYFAYPLVVTDLLAGIHFIVTLI